MRVAIVGSRNYINCGNILRWLETNKLPDMEIVTGGAKGVDQYVEKQAGLCGYPVRVFRPDYEKFEGRVAPLIRNQQIVDYCDELYAFWDGKSTGTAHVIGLALKAKKLRAVFPESF